MRIRTHMASWFTLTASGLTVATAMATPALSAPAFYTRAIVQAPSGTTIVDTGLTTNLSATAQLRPPGTVNFAGGIPISVTSGEATATASLVTGQLHAQAGQTGFTPILPGLSTDIYGFPAGSEAGFGDLLAFTAAGAGASAVTTVHFHAEVHGSLTSSSLSPTVADLRLGVGTAATGDWGQIASPGVTPFSTTLVWDSNHVAVVNQSIVGSFSFIGPNALVPVEMVLDVGGQFGYADFGNTADFAFEPLPAGVTFVSASGAFLISVDVSEPSSSAVLVLGMSILSLVARRRPHGEP